MMLAFVAVVAVIGLMPHPAHAMTVASAGDLVELSLEQLSNIVVTSVSRRAQSLADAPASVYVITHDDIRRSGATSIPEVLRLAPNLQVARADANQYAISARGFNNVLANKLLVMIDGRTIYTPLFSGTFWEAQNVMLEDVDRIEVISGPGATLWGANAVNGVINIITRSSEDTQGTLVAGGGGNLESGGSARYGGKLANGGHFRIYGMTFHRDNSEFADGTDIRDASTHTQGGFRADWGGATQAFTVQGDAYTGSLDQAPAARDISGANLLTSWSRAFDDGSSARVQAYYDHTDRNHAGAFKEGLDTLDIEGQYALRLATVHQVVMGAGYRYAFDHVTNSVAQAFLPADKNLQWANLFVQDQVAVRNDVDFITGVKLESNVYTGIEFLPNVRVAWRPSAGNMLWASYARAVRSPSRVDRDFYAPGVQPYLLAGNDTFDSEVANDYELGYRAQPTANVSLSITGFVTDFSRLRSLEPRPGGIVFANGIEGTNTGVEAWGTWRVLPNWQLAGGVTALRERWRVAPGSVDVGGVAALGNDPAVQWNLRSSWDVTRQIGFDVTARRIGALPDPAVPAYTAVDAHVFWRPSPKWEFSLSGLNLLDPIHAEWGVATNRIEVERGFYLSFQWTP